MRTKDESVSGVRDHAGGGIHLRVRARLVSGDQKVADMEEALMVLVFPFLIVWICSWPF
jgi:hypothetical protein